MFVVNKPVRAWVNQPSTLQPHHNLHGKSCIAIIENQYLAKICFCSGPIFSMIVKRSALEFGDKCESSFVSDENIDKIVDEMFKKKGEVYDGRAITFEYTNWRDENALRTVIPEKIYFGSTEFHKEPQWILRGYCVDRQSVREFAMKDIDGISESSPDAEVCTNCESEMPIG